MYEMAKKEMQIKTTLRFHLMPVRMAIINNTTTNAGKDGAGEGALIYCFVCLFVFRAGYQTQGLIHAREVLNHKAIPQPNNVLLCWNGI
jgi:hypothetical protein